MSSMFSRVHVFFSHRKTSTLDILFILLTFFFVIPHILEYFRGYYYFGAGYYQYLFGQGMMQYPYFDTWREFMGIGNAPSFLNIFYFLPMDILYFLTGGTYLSGILYIWLIYSLGMFFAALLIRYIYPKLQWGIALLIGLFYTSFIPINQEIFYLTMKVASVLLPLTLYCVLKTYDALKDKNRKAIIYLFSSSLLSLNLIFDDARSFITAVIIACLFTVTVFEKKKKANIIYYGFTLFLWILSTGVLFLPFKYSYDVMYQTSAQLSVPVLESVVNQFTTPSQLLFFALPPYHELSTIEKLLNLAFLLVVIFSCMVFVSRKKFGLAILTIALLSCYFLFSNGKLSQDLTTSLPYGQMFRSWRISMYSLGILLILCSGFIFYLKSIVEKRIILLLLFSYFLVSVAVTSNVYAYVEINAVNAYKQANTFLKKHKSETTGKALWIPEMGWFASTPPSSTGPYWSKKTFAQSFPEIGSALPTYTHYNNQLTHVYTWLASGVWESEAKSNEDISDLLAILGIEYVIVHNDIPDYQSAVKKIHDNFKNTKGLQNIFSNSIITIYKNTDYKQRIWTTSGDNLTWCDSGYLCLSELYQNISPYKHTSILTDVAIPNINNLPVIPVFSHSAKSEENAVQNILMNYVFSGTIPGTIASPNKYFERLYRVSCVTDTHQGLHHTYFETDKRYFYDNSFTFDTCFYVPDSPSVSISLPITLPKGKYKMLTRYFINPKGGNFEVTSDYFSRSIQSKDESASISGFIYDSTDIEIQNDERFRVHIQAKEDATNLVNFIAFIPLKTYNDWYKKIESTIRVNQDTLILSDNNGSVSDIVRNNPTVWEFSLVSNKAGVINFAESYSKYWRLTLTDKDGNESEYSSIPGYGIINSFYIDNGFVGDARIEYKPQAEFYKLFALSTAILSCIGLGLYLSIIKFNKK